MKKFFFLAVFLVLYSCNNEDSNNEAFEIINQQNPLTEKQINETINKSIKTIGSFNWNNQSTHFLWSAVFKGNKMVSVGFGISKNDFKRGRLKNNKEIEIEILNVVKKYEGKDEKSLIISRDTYLNQIDLILEKEETLNALRRMKTIRYLEPADYHYFEIEEKYKLSKSVGSGSSGCGFTFVNLSSADYISAIPGAIVPWAFSKHNIPDAWSYSTGAGVTIGLIDTGISSEQQLLGSNFNSGQSFGRSINKFGVYDSNSSDLCGHGTKMASVMVAPRNNIGLPVGIAYNSNLVSYRASANVVLDSSVEQNGVKTAFTQLANNTNVKIISMSMGHIFSIGKIEDAIKYAYSKGKLIFCAGGTSTSYTSFTGVVFPAWMPETQAITGVKEGTSDQKCNVCHSGKEIDFTFQMERASGNTIPVLSYYNGKSDYVGGSSVATAATAGIAALIWSKNPTWTRDQILNKMRESSTFYPFINSNYGYGNINVLKAVK